MDVYTCKAKSARNGEWIYGYVASPDYMTNELVLCASEFIVQRIDQDTICRCTGKRDKYNRMIFEHDIVVGKANVPMVVCWDNDYASFDVIYEEDGVVLYANSLCGAEDKLEIMGNKFDNTELMEVQNESK